MHSVYTKQWLMILLIMVMLTSKLSCASSAAAMQVLVATKALPAQSIGGTSPSPEEANDLSKKIKQDENLEEDKKKISKLIMSVYSEPAQKYMGLMVEEAKERAKILELVNKLTNLLTQGHAHNLFGDEYTKHFEREKLGKQGNAEKEYRSNEFNKKFIVDIEKLKTNIENLPSATQALKQMSESVVVSEKNKAEFHRLVNELEQVGKGYNPIFDGKAMLYGPPGGGKTTLGKKIALDSGFQHILITVPTLINSYQNSGATRLKEEIDAGIALYAKTGIPVAFILDELDSVARNQSSEQGHVYRSTTQALLPILDNFCHDPRFIVIATTNFEKNLHDALRSRFAEHNFILLDSPKTEGRKTLLVEYLKKKKISDSIDAKTVEKIAQKADRFGNREIENLVSSFVAEVRISDDKTKKIPEARCIAIMESARKKVTASNDEYWKKMDENANRFNNYVGAVLNGARLIELGIGVGAGAGRQIGWIKPSRNEPTPVMVMNPTPPLIDHRDRPMPRASHAHPEVSTPPLAAT